jgi:hypothetical protein
MTKYLNKNGRDENGNIIDINLAVEQTASGKDAGLIESLPTQQDAIVQSDTTVLDLMGLRCHAAGDVAIKLTNDMMAVVWTVTAGEIIYGRIKHVMLTGTTLTNAQMTGLK